jgi:hypothetical protein
VELISGADGARTRDLRRATPTLSQLSYGPWAAKCSREFEEACPVDPDGLIVQTRAHSEMDLCPAVAEFIGKEVTEFVVRTVGSERIEFASNVLPSDKPISVPARGLTA